MNQRRWISNAALAAAIVSIAAAPFAAYAQSRDHGGGGRHESQERDRKDKDRKGQDKKQDEHGWDQGKNPKDAGLHDNRDQIWKHKDDKRPSDKKPVLFTDSHRGHVKPSYLDAQSKRRQQTKNEWRNIAILSGAVAALGLLEKDNRLVFAGAAGALYSLDRYEKDRKSQSKIDRARASYFSKGSFYRNGKHYTRRTVKKNGKTYYQFVRK